MNGTCSDENRPNLQVPSQSEETHRQVCSKGASGGRYGVPCHAILSRNSAVSCRQNGAVAVVACRPLIRTLSNATEVQQFGDSFTL